MFGKKLEFIISYEAVTSGYNNNLATNILVLLSRIIFSVALTFS